MASQDHAFIPFCAEFLKESKFTGGLLTRKALFQTETILVVQNNSDYFYRSNICQRKLRGDIEYNA